MRGDPRIKLPRQKSGFDLYFGCLLKAWAIFFVLLIVWMVVK